MNHKTLAVPSASKFASDRLNETLDWLVGVEYAMDEVTALTDEEQDDPEVADRAGIVVLFGEPGEDRKPI